MWATEPIIQQLRWLSTETLLNPEERSNQIEPTKIQPNTLAFLRYTSGSTGNPKGVMVSHENIIYNQQMISLAFQHDETAIVVGWLPPFLEMGLICNVLQPLYLGLPGILMPPGAFLQKQIRWLPAISHYRATTSGGLETGILSSEH